MADKPTAGAAPPASLPAVLVITFLGSISSGTFWAGIFFLTAQRYGFSPARNLVLAAAMGAIYALAASRAGRLLRRWERRASPRFILGATLAVWTAAAIAPLLAPNAETVLWAAALTGAVTSALTWPTVESYLAAGRHGPRMRNALGWFNVTWTPATAVPLLLMPLLARVDVLWTMAISAAVSAAAGAALVALPARPGAHAQAQARAAVGTEYRALRAASSWLLPLSYVMCATLAPVLPHRLTSVGAGTSLGSVVAATWMLARFITLFVMWRTDSWHGRWGTLAAGAVALGGGQALVLLSPTLALVIAGLALFGAGMGLTYYAALYYSLAVGHAAVDAGGSFEALIGLGYAAGPLLGLVAYVLFGNGNNAATATVAMTLATGAAASLPALRPYRSARRARR
ncbi:MAG: hypothetical protein ABUS79_01395 [Pseudomonadota bacterium]